MQQRTWLVAAWIAATSIAIVIATFAVGRVGASVTDAPSAQIGPIGSSTPAVEQAAPSAPSDAPSTADVPSSPVPTTTTVAPAVEPPPTTSVAPSQTESTTTTSTGEVPVATTTTTRVPRPTTTTTTVSTTTTTTEPDSVSSYQLIGGVTTIRVDGEGVHLVAATPSAGFDVEVKKTGPNEVVVEYESESHESEFKASWEDDGVQIETNEEAKDD